MTDTPSCAWTPDDPVRRRLTDALGLPGPVEHRRLGAFTITFVGAGGKTTLTHALADQLAASGARVAITTTTHMVAEEGALTDVRLALSALQHEQSALNAPEDPESAPHSPLSALSSCSPSGVPARSSDPHVPAPQHEQSALSPSQPPESAPHTPLSALSSCSPGIVVLVGAPASGGKIGALPDADLARLREASDYLIVEGDGSRRLPFKVPAAHEPVVPDFTDLLVIVAGLTAIGRPLADVCLRFEEPLVADVIAGLQAPSWGVLGAQAGAAPASSALSEPGAEALDDAALADPVRTALDPALAASLIDAGYLCNPTLRSWITRRVVVLNQADTPELVALGRQLAARLPGERVLLASNQLSACSQPRGSGEPSALTPQLASNHPTGSDR